MAITSNNGNIRAAQSCGNKEIAAPKDGDAILHCKVGGFVPLLQSRVVGRTIHLGGRSTGTPALGTALRTAIVRSSRAHDAGAEFLEQGSKTRVGFKYGCLHRLVQFAASLASGLRPLRVLHFFAGRLDGRIVFGGAAGGFELLLLLGRQRLELAAHVLGAIASGFDFVEDGTQRGVGGQHGCAHGGFELLPQRVIGLFERAHCRVVFGLLAGGLQTLLLARSQIGIGRRPVLFAVLFPWGSVPIRPVWLRLRVVLGRERRDRREETQREKVEFFHNKR